MDPIVIDTCSKQNKRIELLPGTVYHLRSPGYPAPYPIKTVCIWKFIVRPSFCVFYAPKEGNEKWLFCSLKAPKKMNIKYKSLSFDVQPFSDPCRKDFVSFTGVDQKAIRQCGGNTTFELETVKRRSRIIFKSNKNTVGNGFEIEISGAYNNINRYYTWL